MATLLHRARVRLYAALLTAAAVLVAAAHAPTSGAAASAMSAPPSLPLRPVAVGYLPEWRLPGADYVQYARHLTHLIFFSVEPTPAGGLTAVDRLPSKTDIAEAREAAKREGANLKLLVCLGGNGRSAGFSGATARKRTRRKLVSNVAKLVSDLALDGVDYNWEYPGFAFGAGYADDDTVDREFDALAALVADTRVVLGEVAVITAAYYPDGRQERLLAERGVHQHANLLHAMSYDAARGPHSSMQLLESTLANARRAGLPLAAVTVGLPFYGRGMSTGGWTSYEDIVQRYDPLEPSVDDVRDETSGEQLSFNGVGTIEKKVRSAHAGAFALFGVIGVQCIRAYS